MRTKPVNVVYRWETSCPEPISLGYREMAEKIAGLLGQGTPVTVALDGMWGVGFPEVVGALLKEPVTSECSVLYHSSP